MEKAELQQLAARASKGESAAWEALYGEIGKISASVCRKNKLSPEDAEDVTQEASLALSGRLRELAAMDNPEGYIRRVINSKSIDLIRAASKTPIESMHEDEDYVLSLPDAADTPENEVAGTSADKLIKDFIDELPDDQREALIMRYYDGYTNAQIAKKLNVPPGTVASRVRYGKQALEKRITKYEKDNKIRLHAKIAIPFLPWRMFKEQSLKTAEIIATGIVMKNNNNPTDEIVPTQAVTEQVEQIDPTAAAVYKDVYETQTATVYQNVNVNSAQSTGQASEQNKTEQTGQDPSEESDEFHFAGERFESSKNTLTSNTYHSDTLGGTFTFPDSWVNNVEIRDDKYSFTVLDKGQTSDLQNSIMELFCYSHLIKDEFPDEYYYNILSFNFWYGKRPGEDNYSTCRCYLSWNPNTLYRTNLDYSKINSEILSVLESFQPDNSDFTNLLTQQKKDAVMRFTGSTPIGTG